MACFQDGITKPMACFQDGTMVKAECGLPLLGACLLGVAVAEPLFGSLSSRERLRVLGLSSSIALSD